ncbi:MAG TPA: radical SAM protein, partial [Methanocorpusculum sp.]|nr:radical SAM protein [Methanocorpusculum sp.]
MKDITLKQKIQILGAKKLIKSLNENPDKYLPKVVEWVEKLDKDNTLSGPLPTIKKVLSDTDGVWYKFVKDFFVDLDPFIREKLFMNFVVNSVIIGRQKKLRLREELGCSIPWAILMDPTSACNLKCIGCWAAEYGHKMNLTLEEWDSIITQAKDMGTYFFIYSG